MLLARLESRLPEVLLPDIIDLDLWPKVLELSEDLTLFWPSS